MRIDRINNVTAGRVESIVSADGERDIYKADLESVRGERQGKECLTKRPEGSNVR